MATATAGLSSEARTIHHESRIIHFCSIAVQHDFGLTLQTHITQFRGISGREDILVEGHGSKELKRASPTVTWQVLW